MLPDSQYFLEPRARLPDGAFYVKGVGVREWMEPSIVDRPDGTWDWLLMYFHDPVELEVDGTKGRYPAGTLMVWDDTAAHHYGTLAGRWCHSWMHVQGRVVPEFLAGARLRPGVYPALAIEAVLYRYLPLLYAERLRPAGHDATILESLFHCLLREIGRVHAPEAEELPPRLQRVVQHLQQHFHEPMSLDALCGIAALSRPHLIAEFQRHLDLPPIQYLIKLRCEHARFLLLNRNLSVKEVAAQVGYGDLYHFSKLFKKHQGVSPSEVRRQAVRPE